MKFYFFICILFVCGCAQTIVHEDGSRTITGFVKVKTAPSEHPETFAGHVTDVKQIGLHIYKTPSQSGFGLGYSRLLEGFFMNNVLVKGDLNNLK